jgi:GntR family transcriptional regulator
MSKESQWPPKISRSKGLLHTQIANAVASSITLGHFRSGDRLPPERELAKGFGVNRLTVRQALAELQIRKLINRRTGRNGGTFVAEPIIEYDLTTFAGFSEQAQRLGHIASSRILRTEKVDADETTADELQLPPGSGVYEIDRLRFADELPVLLEHSSFPADRFSGLLAEPLHGSIYEVLDRRYDARPVRAVERITPINANVKTARLLGVTRGTPLLRVERVAFDVNGLPVESARDILRADRSRMLVWSFELPTK